VAIIGLVLGFRDSSNLASAYGIAVTGTFVITTCLIAVVARRVWRLPLPIVLPGLIVFLIIDGTFFAANLTKFDHGGWFPLVAAAVIFTVLAIWRWGATRLQATLDADSIPLSDLESILDDPGITTRPGATVYITHEPGVPYALEQQAHLMHIADAQIVILRLETADVPRVDDADSIRVDHAGHRVIVATLSTGFMSRPDPVAAVRRLQLTYPRVHADTCLYAFPAVHIEIRHDNRLRAIGTTVYTALHRLAIDTQQDLHLPPDRVIELGRVVPL
jgi:KUP system potassium uptake protein